MEFKDAINQIGELYEYSKMGDDAIEIYTKFLLTPFNFYLICLVNNNGKFYLTDMAETANTIEKDELYFRLKCHKYNIEFINWHIEKEYKSIEDLNTFIKLLDEISEEYYIENENNIN